MGKNKKFQHGSARTLAEHYQKYIHVKYLLGWLETTYSKRLWSGVEELGHLMMLQKFAC
jgi:hypothetical protein